MAGVTLLERVIGTIDGFNRDFSIPVPYISGTLNVFQNGRMLDPIDDAGFDEVDPSAGTFRMNIAPIGSQGPTDPGDILFAIFQSATTLTGGGADGGIPRIRAAALIQPTLVAAPQFVPKVAAAANLSVINPPQMAGAEDVSPKTCCANDLRPKIASAKEVI